MPEKILLDTDAGVDDIMALLLLLRCPDLAETVGITIVAGNTALPHCIENVKRGLGVANLYTDGKTGGIMGFPVAAGAAAPLNRPLLQAAEVHGPDGLGGTSELKDASGGLRYPEADVVLDPRPAHEVINALAARHPGEITLVAIGPLTNLALAFQSDPAGFRKLKQIVLMGGCFLHDGNTSPRTEFNIYVDPEAAAMVFEAGVPLTIIPLDCSEQTALRPEQTEGDGPMHAFVRDATEFIMEFHEKYEGFRGCFHHDPLALGVALDRSFAQGIETRVVVETKGEYTTGETVAGLRPNRAMLDGAINATVMLKPDAERFERFFQERVLPPGA